MGSSSVKCNLNPTNYIHTTALVMWNVAGTHTRTSNGIQLHAHRQSKLSPEEKMWVLRADLNAPTEDIYLLYGVMWNGMLYDVECLWPGWTTEFEVVQNGVKWWREIAVWCGMSWCDFKCFVVYWIRLCVAFRAVCSFFIM